MVYQGAGRGLGVERVRALQRQAGTPAPDLTFILDLDPRDGLARTHRRGTGENRFEKFDAAFHDRLRETFLAIARDEPDRCVVIDATRPAGTISAEILRHVQGRFG